MSSDKSSIGKDSQAEALINGSVLDLLKKQVTNFDPMQYPVYAKRYLNINRQELLFYLETHRGAVEEYYRKHQADPKVHEAVIIECDFNGGKNLTYELDHGIQTGVIHHRTPTEAVAHHALVSHGLYAAAYPQNNDA